MADSVDASATAASEVYELHERAVGEGDGEEDDASLAKLFERSASVLVVEDDPT